MRPVNLLPEQLRRRASAGGRGGWTVIGVLAVLVAAVGAYVFTANQATSRENEAARVDTEARRLSAEADSLAAFSQFQQLREARTTSVRAIASGRFDWERMVREIAHVLPRSIWLRKFDASTDGRSAGDTGGDGGAGGTAAGGGSTAGAGAAAGPTAPAGIQQPKVKIEGCARQQHQVADALVRLRLLAGVEDVSLVKSERPEIEPGEGGAIGGGDPNASEDSCGLTGDVPNLEWEIQVTFKPVGLSGTGRSMGRVPVALGGGQ